MTFGLSVEPVRRLDQERVPRIGLEQLLEVPRHIPGSLRRLKVVPPLIPDQEQRRPRAILPPHHEIRVEELDVEIAGRCPGKGLEAVAVAGGPWRARKLAEVGPASFAHEWGGVHLDRQGRCGGVVDPERHRCGQLIEVREQVMRSGPVRDRVQVLRAVDVVRRAEAQGAPELRRHAHVDLWIDVERLRMTALALEVVYEHLRDNRRALIVLEPQPRGDVLIASHCRPTPRAAVAEYAALVAERPPDMDPPLILELAVEVRVRGPIRRQPVAGRPELPPIEVPKCPLEYLMRFLPVEGPPSVPPLLIRAEQDAQIIDLEAGRPAHVAGLELNETVAASERQFLGVARERCPCAVERDIVVGPLIVVRRVALRPRNRGGTATDRAVVQ